MSGAATVNGQLAPAVSVEWARDQLRTLFLWDTSEKQTILRAAVAKGFGLEPTMFARPFPGSPGSQVTIVSQDPPPSMIPPATAPQPTAAAAAPPQNVGVPLSAPPGAAVAVAPIVAAGEGLFMKALPWVLTAAMGTGGLGALGGYLLSPKTTPTAAVQVQPAAPTSVPIVATSTPVVTPTPTPAAPKPQEWEFKYKLGPDGKWQTQVAPVTPEP